MQDLLMRQLKDVQIQAENAVSRNAEEGDVERFSQYSEELKNYILKHSKSEEIKKLANEIPGIFDVKVTPHPAPMIFLILLGIISVGISVAIFRRAASIERMRQIENNINTARGKFASIEFLMKAELDQI